MEATKLDTKRLTEEVISSRKALTSLIRSYAFLNNGGMAFADHKGETVRAYVNAINMLQELHYFEELAGLPLTPISIIPECKYVKEAESQSD